MLCCCTTLENATAYSSSQRLLNKSAVHAVVKFLKSARGTLPLSLSPSLPLPPLPTLSFFLTPFSSSLSPFPSSTSP